jgi:hypothetical protein
MIVIERDLISIKTMWSDLGYRSGEQWQTLLTVLLLQIVAASCRGNVVAVISVLVGLDIGNISAQYYCNSSYYINN